MRNFSTDLKLQLRRVALVTVFLGIWAVPRTSAAQCTTDAECTNGRVCKEGTCVYPAGWTPPAQSSASPSAALTASSTDTSTAAPTAYTGKIWATGAGAFGAVNAGLVGIMGAVGMFLASDAPSDSVADFEPGGIASFWVAGTLNAVGAPLVYVGGRSARKVNPQVVRGVRGLRVAGWVFSSLQVAALGVDGALLLADAKMAPVFVGLHAVLLGMLGQVFMAVDTLVSGAQAKRYLASAKSAEREIHKQDGVVWYPILSPVYGSDRRPEGAALGAGVCF